MTKRTAEQTFRYNRTAYCKANYSMTVDQYVAFLGAHPACEICAAPFSDARRPVLDHNHVSGTARGVLCDKCNKGIGLLQDDPSILLAAIGYLNDRGHYARGAPEGSPKETAH